MEGIDKFRLDKKLVLRAFLIVILFFLWYNGYTYYERHQGANTPVQEQMLIYALHELKEIQHEKVLDIEKIDVPGGDRKLKIKVQGDMHALFAEEEMLQAGWSDIRSEKNMIQGKRADCCIQISQNRGCYEICIDPLR